jgi:hypothetical protein
MREAEGDDTFSRGICPDGTKLPGRDNDELARSVSIPQARIKIFN